VSKIVYITGCLGFIGSYVTRKCLDAGFYVRGVDCISYAANKEYLAEFNKSDNFVFENKNINDIEFLYDCDYFINIAAETHVGNSIVCSKDFVNSNVNGVHNILELLRRHRGEHSHKPTLIHFSTDEVYGDISEGVHSEKDLLKPSNPYSATKAAADMLVLAWSRTYKLNYVILRPTNNYGLGQYVEKLLPKAIKYLSLGRKIPLHNNGDPVRNWLHADDTASAVMKIIEKNVVNEIYNICGGFEQKNIEAVKQVIECFFKKGTEDNDDEMLGALSSIRHDDYIDYSYSRAGQDVRYALDDSKLRSLGWKPNKIFKHEISDIVDNHKNKFTW